MTPVSVSISEGVSTDGKPQAILSLSKNDFSLSIWIDPEDLPLFRKVRAAGWDQRGSIRIGESAGSAVFWASDKRSLSIMIGGDDETWDIAFTLPLATLDDILDFGNSPNASP